MARWRNLASKRSFRALLDLLLFAALLLPGSCGTTIMDGFSPAASGEPPTFTSQNGVLDLLVIAEPTPIALGKFNPTAWVFEMCLTSVAVGNSCPQGSQTVAPYGGIRLQLYPGDHLRMKLVNDLPTAPADAENAHGGDPMMNAMLAPNPINIHTHGLIVEPRKADASNPTWGDYIYILGYPAGKMPSMVAPDETATDQPIQYDIYIPPNHPSGLFWFHPHVHGMAVNQLSEGLSGIITIGSVSDYLTAPSGSSIPQRFLILKDMQILGNGQVLDQEASDFCGAHNLSGDPPNGDCEGQNTAGSSDLDGPRPQDVPSGATDYTGGLWFFTVNGQVYPQFPPPAGSGELWRILNAAASRTYDLEIRDDQTGNPMPFQIVALDGSALAPPPGSTPEQVRAATANSVAAVPCPGQGSGLTSVYSSQPVCATHLVMFPSARAEIWVTPQHDASTLLTEAFYTGPAGDNWPEAYLAHIAAAQPTAALRPALLAVRPVAAGVLSRKGILGAPVEAAFAGIPGEISLANARRLANGRPRLSAKAGVPAAALNAAQTATVSSELHALSQPVPSLTSPSCVALPAGHRRRIFFGIPSTDPTGFGLGYEEVDANDNPVPGTFQDIAPFDPAKISVCLPLSPGNTPVTEEWELVNVAGEAHNFHIHQTKFYVLSANAPPGDAGELMDNVALPTGGAGCDGTVATWRSGACPVQTVTVRIPFSQVGDFVYHCHIGEHQDGGMMAHIRVIPASN